MMHVVMTSASPICLSPKRLWHPHWNYACINLIIPVHSTRPNPFKLLAPKFYI
jgi:hypothetical protein